MRNASEKSAGVPVEATPAKVAALSVGGRGFRAGSGVASRIESCGPGLMPAALHAVSGSRYVPRVGAPVACPSTPPQLESDAWSFLPRVPSERVARWGSCVVARRPIPSTSSELPPAAAPWLGANTDAATGLSAMRGFAELNGLRFARSALMGATAK